MRILDTANTTIRTKLRTTAGTATAAKICGPVSEMSRFLYPRDRKGEFEPQLLKKNQTSIRQDIEEKILSMYAKGMTTGDIEAHIQDIYGLSVSDTTVSRITDKILPVAKEWQQWTNRLLWTLWRLLHRIGTINIPRSQSRGRKTGRTSAPTSNILRKSAA